MSEALREGTDVLPRYLYALLLAAHDSLSSWLDSSGCTGVEVCMCEFAAV